MLLFAIDSERLTKPGHTHTQAEPPLPRYQYDAGSQPRFCERFSVVRYSGQVLRARLAELGDRQMPWDRLPACHLLRGMTGWKPIPRV